MSEELQKRAQEILEIQREAFNKIEITDAMLEAIEKIKEYKKRGKIITTGMGKAGRRKLINHIKG